MAGVDVSLLYGDEYESPDDLTDEGFEQGDCLSLRIHGDDSSLSPLLRIQKYAQSGDIFDRHMVPRVVQDIFRTAPADILTKELPDIMRVLTKIGDESLLKAILLENIPSIAAQAVESSARVAALKDVIGDYLIPLVVRNLGCSDTGGADKAAQASLIQLIENGFVSKFQAEIKICPSILALTKMESQLDVNNSAITLMSKLAPLLGKDITERIFLKRFIELCQSNMFYVRKLSASHFGHYCPLVGNDAFEKILLPCYLSLCQDEIWGVRKSCAEVIMFMSCVCPPELRKSLLAPAFLKLLQDECRWVKMTAFQTLGAFIATFADPPLTKIGYNNSGELVMFDHNLNEFQLVGTEGAMNPFSMAREEMPLFSLEEALLGKWDREEQDRKMDEILGVGTKDNSQSTALSDEETFETEKNSAKQDTVTQNVKEENVEEKENVVASAPNNKLNTGESECDAELSSSDVSKESENGPPDAHEQTVDKHEDDLLCYNEYNYWYISPPDVELESLIETRNIYPSEDQHASESLDVMTSHLEDLYATISLNDTLDNTANSSVFLENDLNRTYLNSGDNRGDNLDNTSTNVNTVNSPDATTEPKEPPQKIVPQELIDHFVLMANSEKGFEDADFSLHCAYAMPAVILTLGKENWPLLKNTVQVLAGHMSYKIRRTVASSLHEIAQILESEQATESLCPLFEGFLKDLDEVRIGILKHLAQFLQLINAEKRVEFLPKLGEFLRVDNACNWRFQETLADQLKLAVNLFRPADIVKHIGLYAQALMLYNVAAVRQAAMLLVTEIVVHITSDHGLAANYLSVIAERFAHSKKWRPRQTFALLCVELLKQNALDPEEFASVMMPHLLDLSWDPVANVRLVVANCIVKHVMDKEYYLDPTNEQFKPLNNVLRRLQADKDRDVRMSSEYPVIYH